MQALARHLRPQAGELGALAAEVIGLVAPLARQSLVWGPTVEPAGAGLLYPGSKMPCQITFMPCVFAPVMCELAPLA